MSEARCQFQFSQFQSVPGKGKMGWMHHRWPGWEGCIINTVCSVLCLASFCEIAQWPADS